jgi:hypothetical protein
MRQHIMVGVHDGTALLSSMLGSKRDGKGGESHNSFQGLTPVILATQEVKIRRIEV